MEIRHDIRRLAKHRKSSEMMSLVPKPGPWNSRNRPRNRMQIKHVLRLVHAGASTTFIFFLEIHISGSAQKQQSIRSKHQPTRVLTVSPWFRRIFFSLLISDSGLSSFAIMNLNDSVPFNGSNAIDVVYSQKVFFCVLLAIESFFGSAANFIIILVICCNSFLRTVENAFVVNLAVADFLISFVTQPSSLAGVLVGKQWFMEHPVLCTIVAQLCVCSCMATNSNTLLIAVNRYILICQPHLYSRIYTRLNVFLMCVAAWVGMFFISLPNSIGWGKLGFSDALFMCTFDSSSHSYSVFLMAASVFLPASVTFPAYYGIYRRVRASRHRVLMGQVVPIQQRSSVSWKNIVIAKSLFKAYVVYLLLILPFGIVMVLGMGDRLPHIWYMLTLLLYHGVGTVNCFAYAGRLGKFWEGFRLMFRLNRKTVVVSPSLRRLTSISQSKSNRTT